MYGNIIKCHFVTIYIMGKLLAFFFGFTFLMYGMESYSFLFSFIIRLNTVVVRLKWHIDSTVKIMKSYVNAMDHFWINWSFSVSSKQGNCGKCNSCIRKMILIYFRLSKLLFWSMLSPLSTPLPALKKKNNSSLSESPVNLMVCVKENPSD